MDKRLIVLTALVAGVTLASQARPDTQGKYMGDMDKQEMFKEMDTNADGTLSKDEYMAHKEKFLAEHFDAMDTDENGMISMEEMRPMREKDKKHHWWW